MGIFLMIRTESYTQYEIMQTVYGLNELHSRKGLLTGW